MVAYACNTRIQETEVEKGQEFKGGLSFEASLGCTRETLSLKKVVISRNKNMLKKCIY